MRRRAATTDTMGTFILTPFRGWAKESTPRHKYIYKPEVANLGHIRLELEIQGRRTQKVA